MGLVTIEKNQVAGDLARHFLANGLSVTLLDTGLTIPLEAAAGAVLHRITGDTLATLPQADVVLIAFRETANPEDIAVELADVKAEMISVALIDTRTCDCFPHVREALEENADVVVYLPYVADELLQAIRMLTL